MAALTASSWTVTINKTLIKAGQRETHCTLAVGDGSDTYPTAGIPMPSAATLGMQRNIDNVIVVDSALDAATTTAYVYGWDKTNAKMKMYVSKDPAATGGADVVLQEVGSSIAPAASTLEVIVQGW